MEEVNNGTPVPKTFLSKAISMWQKYSSALVPLMGLVLVVTVFAIITGSAIFGQTVVNNIINQATITAVIATGAVFLFSLGMIDLSLGATCSVAAIVAVLASNAVGGSILVIIVLCIVVSVTILSINGAIIGITKLPSFIVTLVMMNVLSSIARLLIPEGTTSVTVPYQLVSAYDSVWFKFVVLGIVYIIAFFIFNFTAHGRKNKVLGGNRINANLSGINFLKNTFLSYLFCGIAVGIGAFLLITRTATASQSTGTTIGFDVIICLVLGGMSISGGMTSRISAGVIGSFTIVILNNGLALVGVPIAYVQMIRGVIFLTIVTFLSYKSRTKYLV